MIWSSKLGQRWGVVPLRGLVRAKSEFFRTSKVPFLFSKGKRPRRVWDSGKSTSQLPQATCQPSTFPDTSHPHAQMVPEI